jgi:sensor histidine kinase YesM
MQSQQTGTHIGVRNVQRRLQLYYGRGGKMQIESQYEVGTRVTLRMDQTQIETEKEGQIKGQEYENNSN